MTYAAVIPGIVLFLLLAVVGVKLFRTTDFLQKNIFQMNDGDVFSTAKLRKGIEQMKKLYGEFGYIDFVPEPSFDVQPNSDKIDLTLTADEGKQFFVRRIDFSGNTTTRDKVIRREILLDEGDIFNNRLWELSILRLNQLGYHVGRADGSIGAATRRAIRSFQRAHHMTVTGRATDDVLAAARRAHR